MPKKPERYSIGGWRMKPGQRRPAMAGVFSLAIAACLMPTHGRAQEVTGAITVYGWLPGLDADVTSSRGGLSASTSVSASNILDALNFAFMAAGEVHYGRFGLLQDFV